MTNVLFVLNYVSTLKEKVKMMIDEVLKWKIMRYKIFGSTIDGRVKV